MTTFPNGRTYALVENTCATNVELCELDTNQLRMTGIFPMLGAQRRWVSLGPDGSARATSWDTANWYLSTLQDFDASNSPVWNPESMIASAPNGSTNPVPRSGGFGNIRTVISTNNILISFDQSLNPGRHLGGVIVGSSKWLWQASPAVAFTDGSGTYEISNEVSYAGSIAEVVDRNVVYGYVGENFRGKQGQACQNMHFYDDGLFIGQFGESTVGRIPEEGALPGSAGNSDCLSLIKTTSGDYYLWVSDESNHGPQRWHFANARNIREQTGSGILGGTITLTSPICDFPTALTGTNGNGIGELTWRPVPGATSYNVHYSLVNGGPYTTWAGNTTNLDFVVGGLVNGRTYYFSVAAVVAGKGGTPSEQVEIRPFDTNQTVLCAGNLAEGGTALLTMEASTNAADMGQPGFIGEVQPTSLLNLRELSYYGFGDLMNQSVGTKGLVIYNWLGDGLHLDHILSPAKITPHFNWPFTDHLLRQFTIDGTPGVFDGSYADPVGTLEITVNDARYHYLTVVSPSHSADARQFLLQLISTNSLSAAYSVNEASGYSHIFQFLFRGNSTLWFDATGGSGAIVQTVFLDDAPVTYSAPTTNSMGNLPVLTSAVMLADGALQLSYSNSQLAPLTVVSATNLSLPLSDWCVVGSLSNIAPGVFQFTSQPMTNDLQRYFLIRSP